MAKISELTDGDPLLGTDIVPFARGAGNVRGTAQNIFDFVSASMSINDLTDARHDTDDFSSLFLGNGAGANDNGLSLRNLGIGKNSLSANVLGTGNLGIGHLSLSSLVNASGNTGGGDQCLASLDAGNFNTGWGCEALEDVTQSSDNSAFGADSSRGVVGSSEIFRNSTFGKQSGFTLQTGANDNSLFGFRAGFELTTGARNILVGSNINAPTPTTNDHLNIGGAITGDLSTGDITFSAAIIGDEAAHSSTSVVGTPAVVIATPGTFVQAGPGDFAQNPGFNDISKVGFQLRYDKTQTRTVLVSCVFSFSVDTNNTVVTIAIFNNNTQITAFDSLVKVTTGGDISNMGILGNFEMSTGDLFDVRITADKASTVTIQKGTTSMRSVR